MTTASTNLKASRIEETFHALRARNAAALMPFFACGHPDAETTRRVCIAAQQGGADVIELGIPFSDPIADGPVIQAAFASALQAGFRVGRAFDLASSLRRDGLTIPLVAMVSYSLVFHRQAQKFVSDASEAGYDGLIVPDLPHDADAAFSSLCREHGLCRIPLIAPTTTERRRRDIVRCASGFIYYVSVTGITGERDRLPPDLVANVRSIKALSDLPVCIGFGISRAEHAAAAAKVGDGVIVGSALVRQIQELHSSGAASGKIAEALTPRIRELADAAHRRR